MSIWFSGNNGNIYVSVSTAADHAILEKLFWEDLSGLEKERGEVMVLSSPTRVDKVEALLFPGQFQMALRPK